MFPEADPPPAEPPDADPREAAVPEPDDPLTVEVLGVPAAAEGAPRETRPSDASASRSSPTGLMLATVRSCSGPIEPGSDLQPVRLAKAHVSVSAAHASTEVGEVRLGISIISRRFSGRSTA